MGPDNLADIWGDYNSHDRRHGACCMARMRKEIGNSKIGTTFKILAK